jgi:DNA-binding NarL/FixJ family response regulator
MKPPRYTPKEVKELVDRMTTLRTRWIRDVETKLATRKSRNDALTNRERQVAALVGAGFANKIIAYKLSVSEGAVKQNLFSIYRKLGVHNRAMLILALSRSSKKSA